jgi:hypothetical protein
MECSERSHSPYNPKTSVAMYLARGCYCLEGMRPSLERYVSMSLPLITARRTQAACFHCDKDTLEMRSNVACS